jgi:hypothetical protein
MGDVQEKDINAFKADYYVRWAILAPTPLHQKDVKNTIADQSDYTRYLWKQWRNDSNVYGTGDVSESNKLGGQHGGYVPPDQLISTWYEFQLKHKQRMLKGNEMEARCNKVGQAISVNTNNRDLLDVAKKNDNPDVRQKARTLLGWQYVNEEFGTESLVDQIEKIPPEVKQEVEDWFASSGHTRGERAQQSKGDQFSFTGSSKPPSKENGDEGPDEYDEGPDKEYRPESAEDAFVTKFADEVLRLKFGNPEDTVSQAIQKARILQSKFADQNRGGKAVWQMAAQTYIDDSLYHEDKRLRASGSEEDLSGSEEDFLRCLRVRNGVSINEKEYPKKVNWEQMPKLEEQYNLKPIKDKINEAVKDRKERRPRSVDEELESQDSQRSDGGPLQSAVNTFTNIFRRMFPGSGGQNEGSYNAENNESGTGNKDTPPGGDDETFGGDKDEAVDDNTLMIQLAESVETFLEEKKAVQEPDSRNPDGKEMENQKKTAQIRANETALQMSLFFLQTNRKQFVTENALMDIEDMAASSDIVSLFNEYSMDSGALPIRITLNSMVPPQNHVEVRRPSAFNVLAQGYICTSKDGMRYFENKATSHPDHTYIRISEEQGKKITDTIDQQASELRRKEARRAQGLQPTDQKEEMMDQIIRWRTARQDDLVFGLQDVAKKLYGPLSYVLDRDQDRGKYLNAANLKGLLSAVCYVNGVRVDADPNREKLVDYKSPSSESIKAYALEKIPQKDIQPLQKADTKAVIWYPRRVPAIGENDPLGVGVFLDEHDVPREVVEKLDLYSILNFIRYKNDKTTFRTIRNLFRAVLADIYLLRTTNLTDIRAFRN